MRVEVKGVESDVEGSKHPDQWGRQVAEATAAFATANVVEALSQGVHSSIRPAFLPDTLLTRVYTLVN